MACNPCISGAVDHMFKQSEGRVEFCYRAYLGDKHTHLEGPFTVKKPFIGVSGFIREGKDTKVIMDRTVFYVLNDRANV